MAVVVTGVAGFIGFHVARRLLARGEQVVGIDIVNDYYDPALKHARLDVLRQHHNSFHFAHTDFADMAALKSALAPHKFNRVVHLGAQAGVRYSITNPEAYVQSNLVGHVNMLEICRHAGVENLVYASSSSVYGKNDMPDSGFSVDHRVDQPISLYAATKKADELMSETYAHLYRLPQTGLRFFTVYGPWGRPDMAMWLFADAILNNRPINVFGEGNMRRDFTYIDDIVSGILACLDTPATDDGTVKAGGSVSPHRLYNIGNHRSEELMHMVALIEQSLGKKAQVNLLPMQPGDVRDTFADITAIQNDLGYAPTTAIDVGVPKFIEWFKSYHNMA